jgi:multidrug efflux pump subunit AcrA (membrane-fusion protein)
MTRSLRKPSAPPLAAVVTVLAGLAALAGPACRAGSTQPQGPPGMPVKIEVARSVAVDDVSEYVATLRSRGSAAIMPQVEGHVTAIFVRAGARVDAGAPLMQIDPVKQQATVSSQEDLRAARLAAVEFARQQHERVRGLHASGVASQQDLDPAHTGVLAGGLRRPAGLFAPAAPLRPRPTPPANAESNYL